MLLLLASSFPLLLTQAPLHAGPMRARGCMQLHGSFLVLAPKAALSQRARLLSGPSTEVCLYRSARLLLVGRLRPFLLEAALHQNPAKRSGFL